jgi:hypothetical protein
MHISSMHPHPVANLDNKQPPARAARNFLDNNADPVDQPFGKLVSQFARDLDVSPATPDPSR